ncbi:MAG: glutamate racemase [bacterium]|nr:glutamate racemase [bacterium]MDD5756906.1 glutamate racemase [bacterium]
MPKNIGVFDSGVGGLTVVKELMKLLPRETIIYFGDTARVPYGNKSAATVTKYSLQNVRFLLQQDIKLLVVACNTASALSLAALQESFPALPIIGVIEPGVNAALKATKSKKVGVVGTMATISSQAYNRLLTTRARDVQVYGQACPLFVPLVEEGWIHKKVTSLVAAEYLSGMKRLGIDTLILGCTHYPLLKKIIGQVMGKKVTLVDSAQEAALEVQQILENKDMAVTKGIGNCLFYVSDIPDKFITVGQQLLGEKIQQATQIDIEKY